MIHKSFLKLFPELFTYSIVFNLPRPSCARIQWNFHRIWECVFWHKWKQLSFSIKHSPKAIDYYAKVLLEWLLCVSVWAYCIYIDVYTHTNNSLIFTTLATYIIMLVYDCSAIFDCIMSWNIYRVFFVFQIYFWTI